MVERQLVELDVAGSNPVIHPVLIVPIEEMGHNSNMSAHTLSPYVTQYFWGDNLSQLD